MLNRILLEDSNLQESYLRSRVKPFMHDRKTMIFPSQERLLDQRTNGGDFSGPEHYYYPAGIKIKEKILQYKDRLLSLFLNIDFWKYY